MQIFHQFDNLELGEGRPVLPLALGYTAAENQVKVRAAAGQSVAKPAKAAKKRER